MISIDFLKNFIWEILPIDIELKQELKRENVSTSREVINPDGNHLKETSEWLIRAQDSSSDAGVSRAYSTAGSLLSRSPKGWQDSYPETTGYIIPTMIALSDYFNDDEFKLRALRMAEWEIDIQLSSGAVMGSVVTAKPSPAVFNTGQVIFGWLAAFKHSGKQEYLDATIRAGNYLVSVQGQDGSWDKGDSKFALKGATVYNARVAWALIELGLATNKQKYIGAGQKNIEFVLSKQHKNGWFSDNCLTDPVNPLLHTIAYATRGVLEAGICLNESRYIKAATNTLDSLLNCQRSDGGIPGRLKSDWSSEENWDCITGDAQTAISWLRVHSITGEEKYKVAARAAIEFVKSTQNLEHPNPGIRGGVKGSFPFDGPYGKYQLLNWAAKFFCDALMLYNDSKLCKKGIQG